MTSADTPKTRSRAARIGSYVGLAVGLAGVGFLTRLVIRDWDEISDAVGRAEPGFLLTSLVLGLGGMCVIGLNWVYLVRRTGERAPLMRGLTWYFVGQLGKYVPGGVWPVVGRSELAARAGVGRRAAYATTASSMFATYFTAGATGAALAPAALGAPAPLAIAAPLAVVAITAAAFHPRVINRVLGLAELVLRRRLLPAAPSWGATLATFAGHVPAWFAVSLSTWAVARGLSFDVDLLLVAAATPLSWLVGFVVIGLPGGLGVRESFFVAMVGTQTSEAEALSVALLARMVFIGVDICGAVLATAVSSVASRRRGRTDAPDRGRGAGLATPPTGVSGTGSDALVGSPGADRSGS